jgi:hypothetical protein
MNYFIRLFDWKFKFKVNNLNNIMIEPTIEICEWTLWNFYLVWYQFFIILLFNLIDFYCKVI